MERFEKIVLKAPTEGENGELIVRLVPQTSEASLSAELQEKEEKFFTKITAEDREKVCNWVARKVGQTDQEREFLRIVKEAIEQVDYDYWIANIEPSLKESKIYYEEGQDVYISNDTCAHWKSMAKQYKPERGSRLCTLHELFIWYALRIINRYWTLDYIANDSSSAGNYRDAPNSSKVMDKTGAKECGGYKDGQGNTVKIVTYGEDYILLGGSFKESGKQRCVVEPLNNIFTTFSQDDSVGIIVLTMDQFEKTVFEVPSGVSYAASKGTNEEPFFTLITEKDREWVKEWLAKQEGKNSVERKFFEDVKKAIQEVNYDYWIANIEPSIKDGKLYYAKGHDVAEGFSYNQWKTMARDYNPERDSRLCNLNEILIWYALRIADEWWTLHYILDDSSSAGNYCDSPNCTNSLEKTGERLCGGYYDGQGNTYKIVSTEDGYAHFGGCYDEPGSFCTVGFFYCYEAEYQNRVNENMTGVLVLTK